MPIHLEPIDVSAELQDVSSVLIVACPICPPMSLAMQTESPLIELFKRGIKTGAFEEFIREIREPLERRGVRTGVFRTYLPCPTMCLWTQGQRQRFLKRAKSYEAVLVLGCDSSTRTAAATLEGLPTRVFQAMHATGIANATLRYRFPMTLDLQHSTYATGDRAITGRADADRSETGRVPPCL
jgi:hypothetical protein